MVGSVGVKMNKEYENLMKSTSFDVLMQKYREEKEKKQSMQVEDNQPKIEESIRPSTDHGDHEFPGLFEDDIKDLKSEYNPPKSENVDVKMESHDPKFEGFEGFSQASLPDPIALMNQQSQKSFGDEGENRAPHESIFDNSNLGDHPHDGGNNLHDDNNPHLNQEQKMDIENAE